MFFIEKSFKLPESSPREEGNYDELTSITTVEDEDDFYALNIEQLVKDINESTAEMTLQIDCNEEDHSY